MPAIDEPVQVRPGEELDAATVDAAIKRVVPGLKGSPEIREYPRGASNLTYQVRYPDREFVLRRPPFGYKAKSAHDMRREVTIISALRPVYPYVPRVVAFLDDPEILGCDFYLMERIRGVIVRRDLPEGLRLSPEDTHKLCLNVIDKLIELHQLDYRAAGLEGLGKGKGYVQRQIAGWSDRYRKSRTADVGDFETVMAWLGSKMPGEDSATCIIHNDFRFDNVVLNAENQFEVIGVLDWEMATLGDPLMDLGNTLAYWVQADDDDYFQKTRTQPTHLPGMLTRREVIDYYAGKTGRAVENFDFYLIYGLFRLAVIIQQIYYRYFHGQTRNPAFADFGQLVNYLQQRCGRLIQHPAV
ncbi:MAG TPA: phosphotransferase family protein [Terriglobales bacterium]|jgi:aminoglycoside phosphotransferase (APT) family kinase protein|nr:phosphotransferase family protein [Terriglobales bacterium]